jgi:hypothetical protein
VHTDDPAKEANVPAGHNSHADEEDEPLAGLKRPLGQEAHWLMDEAPIVVPYVPAGHTVQFITPVSAPYRPDGHNLQLREPGAENWPAPQSRQVDNDTALKLDENVPPGHKIHTDNPVSLP